MSAPLRKMGSQFRRLDTKFISARNFSSNQAAEAPPGIYERCAAVAVGIAFAMSFSLFTQKQIHGRVFNIMGFPIGKPL
ncbi:hypothetical protein MKW98_009502 [Papaver atlanticum]|uniref:Uncharacterized protein n=1 Tax=Papaver atlanticum TaxID=357466 RepID=A0AAD4SIL4_9MAGN|nr:hypothetical protein MKW98_009502 [Papaver atlanticum]